MNNEFSVDLIQLIAFRFTTHNLPAALGVKYEN